MPVHEATEPLVPVNSVVTLNWTNNHIADGASWQAWRFLSGCRKLRDTCLLKGYYPSGLAASRYSVVTYLGGLNVAKRESITTDTSG